MVKENRDSKICEIDLQFITVRNNKILDSAWQQQNKKTAELMKYTSEAQSKQ